MKIIRKKKTKEQKIQKQARLQLFYDAERGLAPKIVCDKHPDKPVNRMRFGKNGKRMCQKCIMEESYIKNHIRLYGCPPVTKGDKPEENVT